MIKIEHERITEIYRIRLPFGLQNMTDLKALLLTECLAHEYRVMVELDLDGMLRDR